MIENWEELSEFQEQVGEYTALEYAHALQMEVYELLDSFQHKPWKLGYGRVQDRENLKREIIDCLFFLHHIAEATGISKEELKEKFKWVMKNNRRRYLYDPKKRAM